MPNPEHVLFSKETSWGTWVAPAKAIPLNAFKYQVGRARIEGRHTGASRGLYGRWPGAKEVAGSVESPFWSELIGLFFVAAGMTPTVSTPGGATTAKAHSFLPADSAALVGLSAQAQYSGSVAVNLLGLVIDKLTVSCKAGELVTLAADFKAKDEAPVGGTWDYDGTTPSPAIIANPTYFARTIPPFTFLAASLTTGGTVTLDPTTKIYTVATPVARTRLDNLEISLENALDLPIGLGAPTPQAAAAADRTVSVKFDVDLSTVSADFYTEYRAGTQVALQVTLLGPIIETTVRRQAVITLPLVDFGAADWPDMTGTKDRRVRTVEAAAIVDPTSGYDIGVTLTDTQTSY